MRCYAGIISSKGRRKEGKGCTEFLPTRWVFFYRMPSNSILRQWLFPRAHSLLRIPSAPGAAMLISWVLVYIYHSFCRSSRVWVFEWLSENFNFQRGLGEVLRLSYSHLIKSQVEWTFSEVGEWYDHSNNRWFSSGYHILTKRTPTSQTSMIQSRHGFRLQDPRQPSQKGCQGDYSRR